MHVWIFNYIGWYCIGGHGGANRPSCVQLISQLQDAGGGTEGDEPTDESSTLPVVFIGPNPK